MSKTKFFPPVLRILSLMAIFILGMVPPARSQFTPDTWYNVAHAASRQNVTGLRQMLGKGDSPDAVDGDGRPAIVWAVQVNNMEELQMLLDFRATVDARDKLGVTALYTAASVGNLEMVKVLLRAKASVDLANRQGITPLMVAASRGSAPVVRELLAARADPRKQDFSGRDAKGWAIQPQIQRILDEAAQKR